MDILLRVGTARRLIDFGVATTDVERAAVLAQRFRVYQRRSYYRPGLEVDLDEYDQEAVYFMATASGGDASDVILGSARLILGEPQSRSMIPGSPAERALRRVRFRFPVERSLRFELPEAVREIPVRQREEVSRLVTERPEGMVLGSLLTPLGLMHAIALYSRQRGMRCGLASLKLRLLRVLRGAGVRVRDLRHQGVTYPKDGPLAGYFHRHPDPVVPVYFLGEEIVPSLVEALGRYEAASE
jgi:hypothetical protein